MEPRTAKRSIFSMKLRKGCEIKHFLHVWALFKVLYTYCAHGDNQMVNTKIRLIIFSAAKDGTLYSQQNQDWELTWLTS